jgi:hypothetical protein
MNGTKFKNKRQATSSSKSQNISYISFSDIVKAAALSTYELKKDINSTMIKKNNS